MSQCSSNIFVKSLKNWKGKVNSNLLLLNLQILLCKKELNFKSFESILLYTCMNYSSCVFTDLVHLQYECCEFPIQFQWRKREAALLVKRKFCKTAGTTHCKTIPFPPVIHQAEIILFTTLQILSIEWFWGFKFFQRLSMKDIKTSLSYS